MITLQGPQPNHVTHGVGVAYGAKLQGEDSVTLIAYGDGGAQKGEVHEAMNFASIHRVPCVFCCENNLYTQSVPLSLESSVSSIADRAAAYGMPGVSVDGMDLLAVYRAVATAVARARRGDGSFARGFGRDSGAGDQGARARREGQGSAQGVSS